MRLALLTSDVDPARGGDGVAPAIGRLASALREAGAEVDVLSPRPRTAHAAWVGWRFNVSLSASRLEGYDAVLGAGGDGAGIVPRLRVPYVAVLHRVEAELAGHERGMAGQLHRLAITREGAAVRAADAVIVPSHAAARWVERDDGADSARIRVIPEPFDAVAWRAALPMGRRNRRRVLCVSRLAPGKRVDRLLAAWPAVTREVREARLDIVGGGPELEALRRRAQLLPGCRLHGPVAPDRVGEWYASADAFVLPSEQEAFGVTVLEALASALPVVVVRAGAPPELVEGAVAEVAETGEPADLAAAVVRALDTAASERAGWLNPERLERYAPARVGAEVLAVVEEVLRARRA